MQATTRLVNPGDVIAGRFRIDRELGAGAMGIVYAAWHFDLDLPVALKLLTATVTDSGAVLARFRREVRAAAKIRSEHVARVLDVGALESGQPYMVLELLEGNDLEQELSINGPLSVLDATHYVLQAIEALAEAHAAGIIHRDLKPANLFLAMRPDRTRLIKVLDFGISKSLLSDSTPEQVSLTQTGMMMGSPLYMSPEQMQSTRDADARCDIWALGVVLYQLLTGKTPFRGDSIVELCAAILKDRPLPLSHFRDDIPEGLDAVVTKCLERGREARYQNLAELALDLVAFAPSHALVHCERAHRVLFPAPAGSQSPSAQLSRGGSIVGSGRVMLPVASNRASLHSNGTNGQSPTVPSATPGTHVVWNAEGGSASPQPSRRLGRVAALLAGLTGIALVGSYVTVRSRPETNPGMAPSLGMPLPSAAPAPDEDNRTRDPRPTNIVTQINSATPTIAPLASGAPPAGQGENSATQAFSQRGSSPSSLAPTPATRVNNLGVSRSNTRMTNKHQVESGVGPITTPTATELPDYGGRR